MKSHWIFRTERTQSTPLDHKLMFWCVSYYLGAFGTVCCVTTLSWKRAKLVQKFVPRSGVGIFRNERTRSTPVDSKHMFWCVSYYLGASGTVWFPYKTRCKMGWSGAKVRAMNLCRNFSQQTTRSTPLDPNLMFLCISYYLGAFGTVCCVTTLSSKRAKLVQKFVPWSRFGIFHNERTRSTLLDHYLMFRCIWDSLLRYNTQFQMGQTCAKDCAT